MGILTDATTKKGYQNTTQIADPQDTPAGTEDTREDTVKKVVILGAGFGGLSAAIELGKLKKHHRAQMDFDIILIDRNDYQLFTPDLYEIAATSKDITNEDSLKRTVCVDVRVALGQESVGYIQANVETLDTKNQLVHTSKGEVHYDYLIIALGSESFYYGIEGMKENSIPLKSINDAFEIRKQVHDLIEEKRDVHVIVCGAGPAGVEVAAEIRTACTNSETGLCPAMTIVEGHSNVLPMFNETVQKIARTRLQSLGVRQKTDFYIAKAERGKVISRGGEEFNGDLIIWTGGVKASSTLEKFNIELTDRGQISVRRTLQAKQKDLKNVFAIGDNAEVQVGEKQGKEGVEPEYSPQTAHEAVHQGPVAAQNIFKMMRGDGLVEYNIKNEGFVITMGGKHGIVAFPSGIVLKGGVGWFVRKFIDFRHFRSVLPFMQACSVWFQGLKVMSKNDQRM